jgi:hypothetical protein
LTIAAVKMADAKSLAEALEKLTTFLTSKVDSSTSGHRSSRVSGPKVYVVAN